MDTYKFEEDKPLVSIITPTYNHEDFIGKCIESVLDQTYCNWEQIIIDDGSTDSTRKIISQFDDERIRYIRQENLGVWNLGKTYNEALSLSQGDFIAILEGDDFWNSEKLERQIRAFDRPEVVMCWSKAAITDETGKVLIVRPDDIGPFVGKSREEMLSILLFQNPIHSCTAICRKDALLSIGGFKQPVGIPYVDGPTWLELSLVGEFLPLDNILAYYRHHDMQVSSTMKISMIQAGMYAVEFFSYLPLETKKSVAKHSINLDSMLELKLAEGYYQLGRAYLKDGKWSESNENFRQALAKGNLRIKSKAAIGIVCERFKTDLEWAARIEARLAQARRKIS